MQAERERKRNFNYKAELINNLRFGQNDSPKNYIDTLHVKSLNIFVLYNKISKFPNVEKKEKKLRTTSISL